MAPDTPIETAAVATSELNGIMVWFGPVYNIFCCENADVAPPSENLQFTNFINMRLDFFLLVFGKAEEAGFYSSILKLTQ